MARKGEAFAGVTVALVTPFHDDGRIDFAALDQLVDWHVEQGTDCLAPVGTTGEAPTLDHEEHRSVMKAVLRRADGRIKVMPGTGSNSTKEAVSLTKFAADNGAAGALVVGPYYNKPTQAGYLRHFEAIADAAKLPLVVYNIPGRTASNIEPATICKMGEHPHVVAVKEATGSLDQASHILAESELTVLSGDDSLTLPILSVGGSGVVSVIGNILPKETMALVRAARSGDYAEAQRLHMKLFKLCRSLLGMATNPIPIKAAMKLLGRDRGALRLPMVALDADGERKLRETLAASGVG